jgi:hypothetical protein
LPKEESKDGFPQFRWHAIITVLAGSIDEATYKRAYKHFNNLCSDLKDGQMGFQGFRDQVEASTQRQKGAEIISWLEKLPRSTRARGPAPPSRGHARRGVAVPADALHGARRKRRRAPTPDEGSAATSTSDEGTFATSTSDGGGASPSDSDDASSGGAEAEQAAAELATLSPGAAARGRVETYTGADGVQRAGVAIEPDSILGRVIKTRWPHGKTLCLFIDAGDNHFGCDIGEGLVWAKLWHLRGGHMELSDMPVELGEGGGVVELGAIGGRAAVRRVPVSADVLDCWGGSEGAAERMDAGLVESERLAEEDYQKFEFP